MLRVLCGLAALAAALAPRGALAQPPVSAIGYAELPRVTCPQAIAAYDGFVFVASVGNPDPLTIQKVRRGENIVCIP